MREEPADRHQERSLQDCRVREALALPSALQGDEERSPFPSCSLASLQTLGVLPLEGGKPELPSSSSPRGRGTLRRHSPRGEKTLTSKHGLLCHFGRSLGLGQG